MKHSKNKNNSRKNIFILKIQSAVANTCIASLLLLIVLHLCMLKCICVRVRVCVSFRPTIKLCGRPCNTPFQFEMLYICANISFLWLFCGRLCACNNRWPTTRRHVALAFGIKVFAHSHCSISGSVSRIIVIIIGISAEPQW